MTAALEGALARHRAISIAALVVLTLLAWAWLVVGAGMGMAPGFSLTLGGAGGQPSPPSAMPGMPGMPMPSAPLWSPGQGALTFLMWWVMMVAMMLPSAAPTILLYSRVAAREQPGPATGSFLAGYLGIWGGFSALATVMQLALQRIGLVAQDMAAQSGTLSGTILVAAGIYQLSPLKNACLRHCRTPAHFLARHYRPGPLGALRMGALHGAICVGCCWLLMALLFVGGIMNLAWIALLTLMVAAEKLLPIGRMVAIVSGAGCLGWGAWLLAA